MATASLSRLVRRLRQSAEADRLVELSDEMLLDRFLAGDPSAFEQLVWRHGPMVHGLCRRLLRRADDADDAFQAAFLILVRKARAVGKRDARLHAPGRPQLEHDLRREPRAIERKRARRRRRHVVDQRAEGRRDERAVVIAQAEPEVVRERRQDEHQSQGAERASRHAQILPRSSSRTTSRP